LSNSKKKRQSLSSPASHDFALSAQSAKTTKDSNPLSSNLAKATGLAKSSKTENKLLLESFQKKYR
jgi:hypothetical protein